MAKTSRRYFLKKIWNSFFAAMGLSASAAFLNFGATYRFKPLYTVSQKVLSMKGGGEEFLLRPPGARGEKDFLSKCIKCYLCVEACPLQAIKIAGREQGLGTDSPYIRPEETGCDLCLRYDYMLCTKVCPTNALEETATDKDKIFEKFKPGAPLNMGIAILDERVCYAYTNVNICWACYEICPYKGKAVTTKGRNLPTIHQDQCVGCGMCVEICPVPQKALKIAPPESKRSGVIRHLISAEENERKRSFTEVGKNTESVSDCVNPWGKDQREGEKETEKKETKDTGWNPSNIDVLRF